MKGLAVAGLALGIVGLLGSPALGQKGPKGNDNAAKHGWLASLEEGKKQARASRKPLMVVIRCVP